MCFNISVPISHYHSSKPRPINNEQLSEIFWTNFTATDKCLNFVTLAWYDSKLVNYRFNFLINWLFKKLPGRIWRVLWTRHRAFTTPEAKPSLEARKRATSRCIMPCRPQPKVGGEFDRTSLGITSWPPAYLSIMGTLCSLKLRYHMIDNIWQIKNTRTYR